MYESVDQKELSEYLSSQDIRHLYLDSSIRQLIAMQLRSMREARGWSQLEVGEKARGMKQSAIARLEDPRYSSITLSTCLLYTSPSPRDATLSRMPSSA